MIRDPEYCAPSTTTTPERDTGNNPVANREILRRRERPHRELRDDGTALFHNRENLLILLGIDHVDPAAEDADCCAASGTERPL